MNRTIDVSVIIPTYNRISMLEEAIQSALAQDFDGAVEIIVVDDNSSDGTSEIISRKYSEVCLIRLKQNVGCAAARNQGLSLAQGKYIAFLDSDDLWEKNYLKIQISTLEGREKCFSVTNIWVWNTIENKKWIFILKPDLEKYTSPLHHMMVGSFIHIPASVVFPRQVIQDVGLFDDKIKMGNDMDFYARCLISGYTPVYNNQALAIQRKHNKSQLTDLKNQEERLKFQLYMIEKNYPIAHQKGGLNISKKQLYADIYKKYARSYFNQKEIGKWLESLKKLADYTSLDQALSYTINDIKVRLKGKLSILKGLLRVIN
ncbi:MAG: glycosyltransferase family 2 protein [Cyanobacteria bacterium J06592_8]